MANIKITQLGSAQSLNDSQLMIVDDGTSTLKATIAQLKAHINLVPLAEIAENWAEGVDYTKDYFVNWNGYLYKCLVGHQSSVALTPLNTIYWKQTTLGEELEEIYTYYLDKVAWRTGFRNKNLGTSFTADQQAALAAGDFTEFWNGDYWVINGIIWRIVDNTNYQKRRGDTEFTANHLIIMPDTALVSAQANLIDNSDSSGHGYANCAYRTRTDGKGKAQCKTLFQNAFGAAHIAAHRELMSTSRGTGGATGWGWQDADVELPTEANIYGHSAWSCSIDNSAYGPRFNIGTQWGRFKLFEICPELAINRDVNYWLRDIASASTFALVYHDGGAGSYAPSFSSIALRPYAILI